MPLKQSPSVTTNSHATLRGWYNLIDDKNVIPRCASVLPAGKTSLATGITAPLLRYFCCRGDKRLAPTNTQVSNISLRLERGNRRQDAHTSGVIAAAALYVTSLVQLLLLLQAMNIRCVRRDVRTVQVFESRTISQLDIIRGKQNLNPYRTKFHLVVVSK